MYEMGLRILKAFDCIKKCMTTACLVLKHKFIVYIRWEGLPVSRKVGIEDNTFQWNRILRNTHGSDTGEDDK